jgi:transcriptional regulator with XRE-family HTH domain
MDASISFGEYVRRLRRAKGWQLQDVASSSGLSISHLSRIENDSAIPKTETVVKLATALAGDLAYMLELANCLPHEILERLIRRAEGSAPALPRSAGERGTDPGFSQALVEDMDPGLRRALAQQFGLSDSDVEGLFAVLRRMAKMDPAKRAAVIGFLAASATEQSPGAGD